MSEKTFMIRVGSKKSDVKEHQFEEEFTMFGESWVTHRRLYGIGFAVSHKETGFKVPGIDRERGVESKHFAIKFLTARQDQIPGLIAKAKE